MMNIQELHALLQPLLPGLMGMQLTHLSPERVEARMRVRPDLCTTGGILHGGSVMAFADTLGAVGTFLNLGPAQTTTTTDSSTKFMAAATVDTEVRAECVALHRGRTTMVWQSSVFNDQGRLCAVVTQTQLVMAQR